MTHARYSAFRCLAATVVLLFADAPASASPATASRRADVEFRLKVAVTSADRAAIALALWKTGMIEEVHAPAAPHGFYRVYLARPGNLFHMQEVQATLTKQRAVGSAFSIAGWLLPDAD